MKWNIITHNIRGLNDPESIAEERCFFNSLSPKVNIIMLQELSMNGWLASHRPQSLNNACFASLTLASRSNIILGLYSS